jgi:predicted O-methyltransferase YrrM
MNKKLAFMFLTRTDIVQEEIWTNFFKSDKDDRYTIYIHPDMDTRLESQSFARYQIPNVVFKKHHYTLAAQKELLKAAIRDLENYKFILCSEDCIPTTDFNSFYQDLTRDDKSFIKYFPSWLNPGHERFVNELKKESQFSNAQWFVLNRKHAGMMATDEQWFQIFDKYVCSCEHYPSTFLHLSECLNDKEVIKQDRMFEEFIPKVFSTVDFSPQSTSQIKALLDQKYKEGYLLIRKFRTQLDVDYQHVEDVIKIAADTGIKQEPVLTQSFRYLKTALKSIIRIISRIPIIRIPVFMGLRLWNAINSPGYSPTRLLNWVLLGDDSKLYLFKLIDSGRDQFFDLVEKIAGIQKQQISDFLEEFEEDTAFFKEIRSLLRKHPKKNQAYSPIMIDQRLLWYVFVRGMKPEFVVESGSGDGLGAQVILKALKKNKEEGSKGYYYGMDIDPESGFLIRHLDPDFGELIIGDGFRTLKKTDREIDMFIYDSNPSSEYEISEYEAIRNKMSAKAVIISNTAIQSDALRIFSNRIGRKFELFSTKYLKERKLSNGIGISFPI